ncbi:ABC transporter permease [Marinifilum sp.]|uniref:ABC transporter permease n=1 Tax=Marinifilum sp. TaxID=2033137 RepID=UPI003BAC9DC3
MINIISLISVVGVAVGTMALVIVLSAFNGLNQFLDQQYSSFDPDLKILPAKGKTFVPDARFEQIRNREQVAFFAEVLEENALLKYGNRQRPAIVKGVDENFTLMTGIDTLMMDGNFVLDTPKHQFVVLGYGVALDLGVGLTFVDPIKFYVPKRNAKLGHNPMNAFNTEVLYPSGFFQVQIDFDMQYTLVPIDFARKLFNYENEVSAIELGINDNVDVEDVKDELQQILGDEYQVKNRFELHDVVYKMMKTEKAVVFLILAFILLIASFNIIGSLTMLILDKKEDVGTLRSLGANQKTIKQLFLIEGCLISFSGAIIGLVLGLTICLLQIKFGIVKLAAGNFMMNAYPVSIHFTDIFIIFITVVLIGFFASRFPVQYITKRYLQFS